MSDHLTPKPIVDKNGKATTVRVNNAKSAPASSRKLPSGAPAKTAAKRPAGRVGGYELKAYKGIQGREGQAFNVKLYKDGKHILNVRNDGNGGSNLYDPANWESGSGSDWRQDVKDLHNFAQKFNGSEVTDGYSEEGDILLEYMRWATAIEKHADKIGAPRAEVLAANIDAENEQYRKEGLDYLIISDEARANMIAAAEVE